MKKKFKLTVYCILSLVLAVLFLVAGLATLGSVENTGKAYALSTKNGERKENDLRSDYPSVTFYVDNLTTNDKNGKSTTTYLRVKDVYLNVAQIYAEPGQAVTLKLDRSPTATGTQNSYKPAIANLFTVEYALDEEGKPTGEGTRKDADTIGNWIAPFTDLIAAHDGSNFNVSSYHYYRLTTDYNLLINEVVFYGEKLTKSSGDPTGEYCLVPARIYSAKPMIGETQDEADARAAALLDAQRLPEFTQSSYYRLGKEEVYTMMTIAEMRMGGTYFEEAEAYHGDKIYNSLGTSILALGVTMFGNSPFALRFFPMLFGFGTLVVAYFLVLELTKSDKAAFAFTVLYVLSAMTFGLSRLGTPLMIGVFFFISSLYFCYRFYARGMKKPNLLSAMPLVLSGLFGAAAICVNGAYAIAMLAVVGVFVLGMLRQQTARRYFLDAAIAQAEEEENAPAPAETEEGEPVLAEQTEPQEPVVSGRQKVAAVLAEYKWKNIFAPLAFFATLVAVSMLFSLLFALPVYNAYLKLYDNPANSSLNIFTLMAKLFAGGFVGVNGGPSAWTFFYPVFIGAGTQYAVTMVVMNLVAALFGLLGIAWAIYRTVLAFQGKLAAKEARSTVRRGIVLLGVMVFSLVASSFGGGALAFILTAYLTGFIFGADCIAKTQESGGKWKLASTIVSFIGLGLLIVAFALLTIVTFSIPLPAWFMAKIF